MLTLGDHPLNPYGMAGQVQIYFKHWSKKHQIVHIPYEYTHPDFVWYGPTGDWAPIQMIGLPACSTMESQIVGALDLVSKGGYEPDVLWTFGDVHWTSAVPQGKPKAPWVAYFPVDSGDWHKNGIGLEYIIDCMDVPVTYSRWGQMHLKEDLGIETEMIYHIIDRSTFFPIEPEKRKELRRKYLTRPGETPEEVDEKFVVLTVARPQWRKNYSVMIRAMTDFLLRHKNAVWWIHADPRDPMSDIDLYRDLQVAGIGKQVQLTEGYYWNKGIPIGAMNVINNLADVFFLLHAGEGFCLPEEEAAACGVPSVVTNFTTGPEFCGFDAERGLLVDIAFNEYVIGGNVYNPKAKRSPIRLPGTVERPVADIRSAVWALEEMYGMDGENRKRMSENCVNFVKEKFDEKKIMDQWDDLFKKYLGMHIVREIVDVEETDSKKEGIRV